MFGGMNVPRETAGIPEELDSSENATYQHLGTRLKM